MLSVYVNLSCQLILMSLDNTQFFNDNINATIESSQHIGLFKFLNPITNECMPYSEVSIDLFDFETFDSYFKSARAMAIIASCLGGLIAFFASCSCHAACNSTSSCSCMGFIAFIACVAQSLVFLVYLSADCVDGEDGVLGGKQCFFTNQTWFLVGGIACFLLGSVALCVFPNGIGKDRF